MTEFVTVARTGELSEGDLLSYEVAGRYVAVACTGGAHYAFDDVCTHRGCSLSEGELEGTSVVCPCHVGTFDVRTGEVLDGPPPEPIQTYPVRVEGHELQVSVS